MRWCAFHWSWAGQREHGWYVWLRETLWEWNMIPVTGASPKVFFAVFWITMGGNGRHSKEGKRRTVIKRLKTLTSNFIFRLTLDIVDSYYGTECCSLQFFCERESKITLLKLFKGEHNFHNFLNIIRQSNDRLTKLYSEFDYVRLSLAMELLLFE